MFLEKTYLEEREAQIREDEKRRAEYMGYNKFAEDKIEESKKLDESQQRTLKIYKNRTSYRNATRYDDSDEVINKEDIVVQFPWTPTEPMTEDEVKKNQEKRKQAADKLREIMKKKKEEKIQKMKEELADLESLDSFLQVKDMLGFKEELEHRGMETNEDYDKRVKFLKVKLGLMEPEEEKKDEDKFNLLDTADDLLSADQLKQKRI